MKRVGEEGMDISIFFEYGIVLLVLIVLEGLLAADNAMVMAVMVRDLPHEKQKKALFYGLLGAFVMRFAALFAVSLLANVWQVQAVGALYLVFLSVHYILRKYVLKKAEAHEKEKKSSPNFWLTVIKVEFSDLAFAIDSILAGVALAITLTPTGLGTVGGMDVGQFVVVFLGGFIGVVIMRFAANGFIKLLAARPGLETGAFLIVGWVGVKLAVITLCHEKVSVLPAEFAHSTLWTVIFWSVMVAIAVLSWVFSGKNKNKNKEITAA